MRPHRARTHRVTPSLELRGRVADRPVVAVPPAQSLVARELAGEAQTSFFSWSLGEMPHPSKILRTRSKPGQRLGELWDYMLDRDGFLVGLWSKRWKASFGLPRYILPPDETPKAKNIANFCRLALSEVPGLHTNLVHQAEAQTHGWSAEEIMWQYRDRGPIAGKWGLDLVDRPMHRFLYKRKDRQLYVRRPSGVHVLAPPGKFLINRVGSKDNPWGGKGFLHHLYWYWFAGEHAWKYFAVLLEKWAQPTAVGRYKRNASGNEDNINTLFQALHQIQTEYSIVIPDDLVISLLEAQRGGDVSYATFIELANLAKALVVLGEGDTSGLEQGQGSFARRKISNEVRLETIRIDAHEFDAHMTDNLLRLLVEVNFGVGAPIPFWYTEVEDAEDLKMRQGRADAMLERGLPLVLEDYYRLNRQRLPRAGESTLRLADREGLVISNPPEGFPSAEPERPDTQALDGQGLSSEWRFTAAARAALRRYKAGDIHEYRLAA